MQRVFLRGMRATRSILLIPNLRESRFLACAVGLTRSNQIAVIKQG